MIWKVLHVKQFVFYHVTFTQGSNSRLPVPLLKLGFFFGFFCVLFPFAFVFLLRVLLLRLLRADFQFESILRICSSNMAESLIVIEYICINSRTFKEMQSCEREQILYQLTFERLLVLKFLLFVNINFMSFANSAGVS